MNVNQPPGVTTEPLLVPCPPPLLAIGFTLPLELPEEELVLPPLLLEEEDVDELLLEELLELLLLPVLPVELLATGSQSGGGM